MLRLTDHSAPSLAVRARVFGVPVNVTQAVSFAPNLLIKQGAKPVPDAEDAIEEVPTPVRAAITRPERSGTQQRNLLVAAFLSAAKRLTARSVPTGRDRLTTSWKTPA